MPLPFALDHINLWLLEDGPGWTIVDTGYATAETTGRWERIFAERLGGLPIVRGIVTHRFALDQVNDAFRTAADKSSRSIKVAIQPSG